MKSKCPTTPPCPIFAVGDKVAYSYQFLRDIGAPHGDMARARGVIVGIEPLGSKQLCEVDFGPDYGKTVDGENWKVIGQNLAKIGPNRRFCNVD